MTRRRRSSAAALTATLAAVLAGCASPGLSARDDRIVDVVTTTGILADIARHVGGADVRVVSIVPDGADPHSYEPTLRRVRDVVYADVAFSNYLLLEEHAIIKTLDANLPAGAPNVSLAEESVKYAAELIPLVEDVTLDTVWLGLRVRGDGEDLGADRSSDVLMSATEVDGPGRLAGYLTGSFGDIDVYFDSADGFDAGSGYRDDTARLPVDAHTHMSWAFSRPGVYRLDLRAQLRTDQVSRPLDLAEATFTFAVGVDPSAAGIPDPVVLSRGHADLAVDLEAREFRIVADETATGSTDRHGHDHPHRGHGHGHGHGHDHHHHGHGHDHGRGLRPEDVVIEVPNRAITTVPGEPGYRFLGRPGTQVHQLPQAVLGKHVHGEIDPHLWHDVRNVQAYAEAIRDTLIGVDPDRTLDYHRRTAAYLAELEETHRYVTEQLAAIPAPRRHLITTHDAFAYLARAYGLSVSGFVTPNPAVEPSLADRARLSQTIRNLEVPAVFLEPNLAARSSTLTQIADQHGIAVCPLLGDSLTDEVRSYVELMRHNADSLRACLG